MFLSNEDKAEMYRRTLQQVQAGWRKDIMDDGSRVCLRGAVERVVDTYSEREVIEDDMVDALLHKTMWLRRFDYENNFSSNLIEIWNDIPWRRKRAVVKFLKDRIRYHEKRAKQDQVWTLQSRVQELNAQIEKLNARIHVLEAENKALAGEVSWFKARRAKVTAKELVDSSIDLAQLDKQLDQAHHDLIDLTTS